MPDRVVALQLLSSYWLAVILPPLPGILCFSAIYNNERISALSALSPYFHQGKIYTKINKSQNYMISLVNPLDINFYT